MGHWTLYTVCGSTSNGKNVNCGKRSPAYPFDPVDNFGADNVPPEFHDHSRLYFYGSRFMFAFLLIALTFTTVSVLTGSVAICARVAGAASAVFASVPPPPFPTDLMLGGVGVLGDSCLVNDCRVR
jgi:SUR7 family protein